MQRVRPMGRAGRPLRLSLRRVQMGPHRLLLLRLSKIQSDACSIFSYLIDFRHRNSSEAAITPLYAQYNSSSSGTWNLSLNQGKETGQKWRPFPALFPFPFLRLVQTLRVCAPSPKDIKDRLSAHIF